MGTGDSCGCFTVKEVGAVGGQQAAMGVKEGVCRDGGRRQAQPEEA